MISDDELLAACLAAGEPGTESHRRACRLYRQSVIEWRAGHAGWRRERESRAVVGILVALLAEAAGEAGWGDGCGTYRGYRRHIRAKTLVCPRCNRAMLEYKRERRRVRKLAAQDQQALREAA